MSTASEGGGARAVPLAIGDGTSAELIIEGLSRW